MWDCTGDCCHKSSLGSPFERHRGKRELFGVEDFGIIYRKTECILLEGLSDYFTSKWRYEEPHRHKAAAGVFDDN